MCEQQKGKGAMTNYSRRTMLALAAVGAGFAVAGRSGSARADDLNVLTCSSIPSTADPDVIKVVYEVGVKLHVSDRVMLAGFEAGWVESHMNNLPCGDSDSLGVFQQRPSQGWGTPEQIMNVAFASNSFFTQAITVAANNPGWTAGQVAQGVQRSAFPDRYDAAQATARDLIERARALVQPPAPRGGAGAVFENGRYHVFGISPGGVLYQNTWNSGWSGWQSLGGTVAGTPAVTYHSGRFDVFAESPSGVMYQKTYNGSWGSWRSLGGSFG
jgi:hypothetical protein